MGTGSGANFGLGFNESEVTAGGPHSNVTNPTAQQGGTGVSSVTAGTGIGVTPTTGAVVVSNTGVTALTAGTNITLSGSTGNVTVSAAGSAVTSVTGGTNVTVSPTTGATVVSVPTFPYADVTGAPTSLPPNGTAGGDLTGTYPNPTIAANAVTNAKLAQMAADTIKGNNTGALANAADLTVTQVQTLLGLGSAAYVATTAFDAAGAAAAAQAAAEAASYPGLGAIPPSSPNGKINWNLRYFVEDYATIQLALTAAANAHGVLMLPPGITALPVGTGNLGLQLPSGFTGYMGVRGCGSRVSILQQSNAANGVTFDLSAANPAPNSFIDTGLNIDGFSVVSNNAGCLTALYVNYGTNSPGSISGKQLGHMNDVEIRGGGWRTGYDILNAWNWHISNIYSTGDSGNTGTYVTGTGPGMGGGIIFDSCVNIRLSNCGFEWWRIGISIPTGSTAIGPSQGIQVNNVEMLECVNCINSYGTLYVTGILFDNGNLNVASKCSIVLTNTGANGSQIVGGQVLQNGGANAVQLNNVTNTKMTGLDLEYMANLTGYVVRLYTGTTLSNITGNTGGGSFCQLDSGSSVNKVTNNELNGGTNLDNGTNNTVGDSLSFTSVQSLAGGATLSFTVSCSGGAYGKKPGAAPVACTSPPGTSKVLCAYDYGNASNTATLAYFVAYMSDLTSLPTGSYRFNGTFAP